MNAEFALAQASSRSKNQNQEQKIGQRAALDGHDADIPTDTHSSTSTISFTTPTQGSQSLFSSHAPSPALPESHNATATAETLSLASTTDAFFEAPERPLSTTPSAGALSSLPPRDQYPSISMPHKDPSPGLLPSTISQWLPGEGLSAPSKDQMIADAKVPAALGEAKSTRFNQPMALRPQEKDTWIAPGIPFGSIIEASLLASKTVPSTTPKVLSKTASGLKAPTEPGGLPPSVQGTAPHPTQEAASSSGDAKNVLESYPEVATSPIHEAHITTDPERVSTSTIPAPDERGTPASFNVEKEIDLEAGHRSDDSDKKETDTIKPEAADPNMVDWDGPDDPKNPINWSEKLKWANVAVIASITFLTPLASSILAPAVPQVMAEFKSSNEVLASFVVSVYVLGYAFGPIVIAPLSELYGRLAVYHVCNVLFIVFTVACAVSSSLNMLIGWRFLQGTFGSCPLTIGGGTISDMIVQQKRGAVMAIWALGPIMGPIIGPVAGGYLAQAKGWRWGFWIIAMAAGFVTISAFFSLQESYAPLLLERKAKRLRKETGNGNLRSKLASPLSPAALFKVSIVRPMKLLFLSPIVLALSTYMAVGYGYLYLLFTTITEVYEGQYNFSQGSVGLTYIGLGVGSLVGVVTFGIASDKILKAKSKSGEMKAEYRLPPMIPGSFIIPIGFFVYGWTAEKHVFWLVPLIGTGIVGLGILAIFMPIQTYLVDAFTIYAASAIAANTVLRSLVGALLPLAGRKMYATLGLGWGNSLLAFIAIAACPIPIIFYKYGERIRKNPRFQVRI